MMSLLRWVTSSSMRILVLFGLIVIASVTVKEAAEEYEKRAVLQAEVPALEKQQQRLIERVNLLRDEARKSARDIGSQTRVELEERRRAIRTRRAGLDETRLSAPDFAFKAATGDTEAIARDLEQQFRLQLLLREEALIGHAIDVIDRKRARRGPSLSQIKKRVALLERRITEIETRHPTLTRVEGVPVIQNFVGPWRELRRTRAARNQARALLSRRMAAEAAVANAERKFRESRAAMVEAVPQTRLLSERLRGKQDELAKNGMTWIWDSVRPVLWRALKITALIILTPPAIKWFWFFVVARIAARLAPVRIRPDLGGDVRWDTEHIAGTEAPLGSSVSRRVLLRPGDELLIKPEYLQSSMNDAHIDTGVVLNRKFLFASLATGLAGLTRIRVDRESSAAVSATRDLVDEVAIISIPEGSAMVFQPRNLIGVLQRIDRPLRIESHWRLGHLSAWLTMQLRYLVFHGPCALVVKGARGVALEPADRGRRIAGAATMGWSAGLAYSVRRSETFFAYLTGKQSLFNDSFDGAGGKIVYEQMPRAGVRGGFWGRGLEGIGDGLLKIVGL